MKRDNLKMNCVVDGIQKHNDHMFEGEKGEQEAKYCGKKQVTRIRRMFKRNVYEGLLE